jgi:uncharacterized protein
MIVGSCRITLRLSSCHSLKEKRHIVKSLKDRIINRFDVSIAEVADHDLWQKASLGVAMVSTEKVLIEQVFSKIMSFISGDGRVEIIDFFSEID